MPDPKAAWDTVTFDCYGTLVDWETGIGDTFVGAAASDGLELSRERVIAAYHEAEAAVEAEDYRPYRQVLARTALRVAESVGWRLSPDRAGFLAQSLPGWPLYADTRAALERLRPRYRIAILSNVDDDLLDATIRQIGVDFDWVVTAESVRSYKPAAEHFRAAVRRAGGRAERILHVAGSYYHDIRPARRLGLAAVWINRQAEIRPDGPEPIAVFNDLTRLADWLTVP